MSDCGCFMCTTLYGSLCGSLCACGCGCGHFMYTTTSPSSGEIKGKPALPPGGESPAAAATGGGGEGSRG